MMTDASIKRRQRRTRGKPSDIDRAVGRRLKERRQLLGRTQSNLAERLDVTFQQIQKYERGSNRIGASRVYLLAQVMEVSIAYFFEGKSTKHAEGGIAVDRSGDPHNLRETQSLAAAFHRIEDPIVRRRLYDLARAIGASGKAESNVEAVDGGSGGRCPAVKRSL